MCQSLRSLNTRRAGHLLRNSDTSNQVSYSHRPSPASFGGARLPGQACTKQDWLRNWSDRQLPPGRGGLSSSRCWKTRPRPQLRLQSLQPVQGANTQSTAGDSTPGLSRRLKQEQAQDCASGQHVPQSSSSEPSWQFTRRSQRCSRGRHSPLPHLS